MTAAASRIVARLAAAGLSASEASRKDALFLQAGAALDSLSGERQTPTRAFFVPGRIEMLGKHTDYAGGRSLICATERGFCMIARPRSDRLLRIVDASDGSRQDLALDPRLSPGSCWSVYPRTVARRVARDFPGELRGADIAFASDLPPAAGLSSSSALVVGLFTALADINDLESRPEFQSRIRTLEDRADYLSCVENGLGFRGLSGDCGVGALTGSQDHTAILCCRAGEIAQYAFRPVRRERGLALPEDWIFVVASSGVASDKTGGARDKYNLLALQSRTALDLWNQRADRRDATLLGAATSAPDAPERMREILRRFAPPEFSARTLLDRFDQFLEESVEIIPRAAQALVRRDAAALGEFVDRSQSAAETLLGNQVRETVALQRGARALGAIAASAFGGGFGGSVWAIVPAQEAAAFQSRWAQEYRRDFPSPATRADFFATRPGPALLRL